jgi:hypothetical protein
VKSLLELVLDGLRDPMKQLKTHEVSHTKKATPKTLGCKSPSKPLRIFFKKKQKEKKEEKRKKLN